jgi:hypothetical protein
VPEAASAEDLVARLFELARQNRPITLLVGSGVSTPAITGLSGLLTIADDYARDRPDGGGLIEALRRARSELAGDRIGIYRAYRRAFAAWVSGNEFDIVAQEAVLRAYRPTGSVFSGRGRWQRVEASLGESLENDLHGWTLPAGLAALGTLLAEQPNLFHHLVLTTNFDPLLEIAVRRAGGTVASVPLSITGPHHADRSGASITVHHLHGYWRPHLEHNRLRLLDDPDYLVEQRGALAQQISELVRTNIVCVVGYSGWDGLLADALRLTALRGRRLTILWATHRTDPPPFLSRFATDVSAGLPLGLRPLIALFTGVDGDSLLRELAHRLGVSVPPPSIARQIRHSQWEREFVSEPGTRPPAGALDLIRQLDRRFQWERSWSGHPVAPSLVFWPVRLRSTPSVINMAQALAAAALSARGAHVIACLDDFNVEASADSTARFTHEVRRWFAMVPGSEAPEFVSLEEYIEHSEAAGDGRETAAMKRPIRPWDVAREALGERNPSVLSVLMAAKIVPELPADQFLDNADKIIRALESESARRLLTPFTLWAYLNRLLVDRPTASVMTLGGREESRLWELWRLVFDHGVGQLYNPTIRSLTNQSLMLRWSSTGALRSYLEDALHGDDWAESGHYFKWLVQNAFLLPTYLADREPPTFEGIQLDSWSAVNEVTAANRAVVDLIAERVSAVYLGEGSV